jgi:hypothetical protein
MILENVSVGPILSFCASKTELVYSTASHGSLEIHVVKPYLKQIVVLKDPFTTTTGHIKSVNGE